MTMQRITDKNVIRIAAEAGADLALALTGDPEKPLTLMLTLTDEYGYRYQIYLGSSHVREIHDALSELRAMTTAELEATVQELRAAEGQ